MKLANIQNRYIQMHSTAKTHYKKWQRWCFCSYVTIIILRHLVQSKRSRLKKKTILQNHHSNLSFFACQRIFQACKKHSKKDCLATKQRETILAHLVYFLIWYSVQYPYIGDKYKLYAKLLH